MGPGDAIHAGFADTYVPETEWPALKTALVATGSIDPIRQSAKPPPTAPMTEAQSAIDRFFAPDDLPTLVSTVAASDHPLAVQAAKALKRNAPLSMATALRMLSNLGRNSTIEDALRQEYRVSHRIMEHGDFLEGIRAAIIDKDKNPNWRHDSLTVPQADIDRMLAPLGPEELTLEDTP
jgi:enoyl-CoA hydratase/carnithine racemase